MFKRNFNGGGTTWRGSSSSSSSGGNQATGSQVHGGGGGGQDRSNEIQEKIKRQQDQKAKNKADKIVAQDQVFKTTDQEDYFDAGWAEESRYKPPKDVYGKGAVPAGKRQQYTHETMGHKPFIANLIKGLSQNTLDFWGVKQGAQTIPTELYQQLIQGSIVSGNEAVENKYRDKVDQEWGIGTWDDIGAGEHPMFPGGLKQYYSDMAPSFYADNTISDGYNDQGGDFGGYGGGYGGGGGGSGGGGGGGYEPPEKFMPRGNPNEAWGPQNPLQQAMISIHGGQGFQQGFARGGIVSLVT